MAYLEEDDSMPAFIRDIKAYSDMHFNYHSQHGAAIRQLKDQNEVLVERIKIVEKQLKMLTSKIH